MGETSGIEPPARDVPTHVNIAPGVRLHERDDGRFVVDPDELTAAAQCCGGACAPGIGSAAR